MASFGGAFTGQDDNAESPLKDIVSNAGSELNRALFADPESRAALMQIGLQLMQPQGIGQTTMGTLGQGIGAGGEAVARISEEDRKERETDIKANRADDALTISEMRLAAAREKAKDPNVLTEFQKQSLAGTRRARASQERSQSRLEGTERRKAIDADVKAAVEARDAVYTEDPTEKNKWKGKSNSQIRTEIETEYNKKNPAGGGEDPNEPKLAPDGNYYVPDPKRPGKYLKVTQ